MAVHEYLETTVDTQGASERPRKQNPVASSRKRNGADEDTVSLLFKMETAARNAEKTPMIIPVA